MKRVLILITLTALVLGITACSDESKAETTTTATTSSEAPALPSDVAEVAAVNTAAAETAGTATVSNAFEATGEFMSPVRSELSPKLPGRVAKMYVDEGSRVHRGQPVLLLESDYARINLQSAEAEAARAKAVRDEAARDLERKKELMAKSSIPKATFDRSQAMFEQTTAAYAGANAQVALLRQQIADSTMRSPVDGIVAEKRTDVGARLGEAGVAFVFVQLSARSPSATASPPASIPTPAKRSKAPSKPSAESSTRKREPCSPKRSSPTKTGDCGRVCSREWKRSWSSDGLLPSPRSGQQINSARLQPGERCVS